MQPEERGIPTISATAAPLRAASAGLVDGGWGWVRAEAFSLEVPVPEASGWRVESSSGRWFSARHVASGYGMSARAWSARRTVSRAECEEALHVERPDLRRGAESELLHEGRASEPAGYDAWLRVWTDEDGAGTALAVGAGPGRCFAVVFRARGNRAEVGRALRLMADQSLSRVRVVNVEGARAPRRVPAF